VHVFDEHGEIIGYVLVCPFCGERQLIEDPDRYEFRKAVNDHVLAHVRELVGWVAEQW
jgi:hypothetical protein